MTINLKSQRSWKTKKTNWTTTISILFKKTLETGKRRNSVSSNLMIRMKTSMIVQLYKRNFLEKISNRCREMTVRALPVLEMNAAMRVRKGIITQTQSKAVSIHFHSFCLANVHQWR
ncbi:hypothetical protein COOONC_14517 [Cooperia oncophora]